MLASILTNSLQLHNINSADKSLLLRALPLSMHVQCITGRSMERLSILILDVSCMFMDLHAKPTYLS